MQEISPIKNPLEAWNYPFIQSYALQQLLQKKGEAFHSAVKRALKKGTLVQIRRGLYRIDNRTVSLLELAQVLHGPSFISLESSLEYHGWIPEAVYTVTSVCIKRHREIATPLGLFTYNPIPIDHFYLGVQRLEKGGVFLMASPWRAIADLIYTQKREWKNRRALCDDLRIEPDEIQNSDLTLLEKLANHYPNQRVQRVQRVLYHILKSL